MDVFDKAFTHYYERIYPIFHLELLYVGPHVGLYFELWYWILILGFEIGL